MKKFLSLFLAFIILCSCFMTFSQPASAYPTNWGKYSIDYINDLNTKYHLLTQEEIDSINQNDEASLNFVLKLFARVHYSAKNPTSSVDKMPKNYIKYCIDNEIFDDYLENYNVDVNNLANYDLVVDTTFAKPEEIYELIDNKLNM